MARVLVIGGGIAGAAAALALRKAGQRAVVHEAHPDSAEDVGAFLTLASNGLRALAQIDASDAVTSLGFPLTSMRVVDATGAEAAHVPLGADGDPRLRYRCLRRGELSAALQAEAVRRGIEIVHGSRLVSVSEGPEGVTAHFADGGSATGDLLLGADGLNSTVRRATAPTALPRYAGQRVFYGYTADAPVSDVDETACITMIRGSAVAFGHMTSPGGETSWFARVNADEPLTADEIAHAGPGHWRDLLLPSLRPDRTAAADIVASTKAPVLVTNATEIPNGTPWRSGRTLLVGDAAHAASPATGQGASMALEDAVILAKCLRDAPDPDSALTLYETLRRPRVEHNTTVSGNISRGTHTPAPRPTGTPPPPRPSDDDLTRQLTWNTGLL
ncbi:2-polyprenyl-6-methoxyphenol hydroxylase-like FAD-dependent oxidoreductase [Streptomyces sp. B4I13]|uniref:FAD-dependent oxidoreductase n=1 Tax=Streptomyces sp. B4I13 TaxID=3042271 RepID=UPI002789537F|nr:FAD-dependent monooxygenase [Streptomyces sp. B4I13]MDQ0962129.1 2-polyprenyl-6-methoxyphenol hydroxylase-like FAD-dependent oxidoreductase [Streptomyces sp. B4I13]